MSKKIVIALGGNALGKNLPEQMEKVRETAKGVVDLIQDGNDLAVVHGNGPQVGMIQEAMMQLTRSDPDRYIPVPLSVCGAMSQGYIGYDMQNAFREEMLDRGIEKGVAMVLTQITVDENDPAFENLTKPIGPFMSEEEAKALEADRGYHFIHDPRQGFRRVVASPKPGNIVEIDLIKTLFETGHVVIACGGGGIPVIPADGHHLKGAAAVIDKDFAAQKLARQLDADTLIILTAVPQVAINYGKEDEQWLSTMTTDEARKYIEQGEFDPGSMLPKVQACISFVESKPGRTAMITETSCVRAALAGKTGTVITASRYEEQ